MSYQPPYKITSKILTKVSEISEALAKLDMMTFQKELPKLRRINKIKTITGTLQIEGSTLSEEKITAILDGKRVLATLNELTEAKGAIALYSKIENLDYKKQNDLLKAHQILMHELLKNAGKYRTSNVGVGGKSGVVHVAPPPLQVPKLMSKLFEWLSESDEHLLIKSSVFHYEFEFIHPFSDGNGRIGRFWQSLILYRWKNIFNAIPIESIIRDKQKEYYDVLEICGKDGESTAFIEFMLDSILEAISEVGNRVGNRVGNLTDNQIKIMEQIVINNKISASKLSEIIGISKRKIEENLAKLKETGILNRVGGTRGHWEISNPLDPETSSVWQDKILS